MITIEQNGSTAGAVEVPEVLSPETNPRLAAPPQILHTIPVPVSRPVSAARAEASRRNGRLSRGPKTARGKLRSRVNALKHGLFADVLPKTELPLLLDRKEYDLLIQQLQEDMEPRSQLELTLIESLAFDLMRLRCIHALEATIWEDGRPPGEEERRARSEMDDYQRKQTEEKCLARRELLTRFLKAITDRKDDALTEEEKEDQIKSMQKCFAYWQESVQWYQERIKELELKLKANLSEAKAAEPKAFIKKFTAGIEHSLAQERVCGAAAHGCENAENIAKYVRKPSEIPEQFRLRWRQTISQNLQKVEEILGTVYSFKRKLNRIRIQRLQDLLLQRSGQLELMGRYETMVRRNVDRTLNQLNMVRHDLFA